MFVLFSLDKEGVENDSPADERVQVWKYLFQMFKLFNCEQLFPRIERYCNSKKIHEQKMAIEMMNAVARAIPYFDFDQLATCRKFFLPIFDKHLRSYSEQVANYWDDLFDELLRERDVRRVYWVVDYLIKLFTTSEAISAFHHSSVLTFISAFLVNNWRFQQESRNILAHFEKYTTHKIQMVRNNLSGALVHVFNHRVGIGIPFEDMLVGQAQFIDRITAYLHQSLSTLFVSVNDKSAANMATARSTILDSDTDEGQTLHNYLETISTWVTEALSYDLHCQQNTIDFVKLAPYVSDFCYIHLPSYFIHIFCFRK